MQLMKPRQLMRFAYAKRAAAADEAAAACRNHHLKTMNILERIKS
jgi:hypothetical protein